MNNPTSVCQHLWMAAKRSYTEEASKESLKLHKITQERPKKNNGTLISDANAKSEVFDEAI